MSPLLCHHLWRDVFFLEQLANPPDSLWSQARHRWGLMCKGLQRFLLPVWPRGTGVGLPHSLGTEMEGQPRLLHFASFAVPVVSKEAKGDSYGSLPVSSMGTFALLFLLFLIVFWHFKRKEGRKDVPFHSSVEVTVTDLLMRTLRIPELHEGGSVTPEEAASQRDRSFRKLGHSEPFMARLPWQPPAEPTGGATSLTTDWNPCMIYSHSTYKEPWTQKSGR